MRWRYETEHTPECDDTRGIVYAHVTGYEWEYECDCPERRYVSLEKPKPPSPLSLVTQHAYETLLVEHLSKPLFVFGKKRPRPSGHLGEVSYDEISTS